MKRQMESIPVAKKARIEVVSISILGKCLIANTSQDLTGLVEKYEKDLEEAFVDAQVPLPTPVPFSVYGGDLLADITVIGNHPRVIDLVEGKNQVLQRPTSFTVGILTGILVSAGLEPSKVHCVDMFPSSLAPDGNDGTADKAAPDSHPLVVKVSKITCEYLNQRRDKIWFLLTRSLLETFLKNNKATLTNIMNDDSGQILQGTLTLESGHSLTILVCHEHPSAVSFPKLPHLKILSAKRHDERGNALAKLLNKPGKLELVELLVSRTAGEFVPPRLFQLVTKHGKDWLYSRLKDCAVWPTNDVEFKKVRDALIDLEFFDFAKSLSADISKNGFIRGGKDLFAVMKGIGRYETGTGIFKASASVKLGWAVLGGKATYEKKVGIFARTQEQIKIDSAKGAKMKGTPRETLEVAASGSERAVYLHCQHCNKFTIVLVPLSNTNPIEHTCCLEEYAVKVGMEKAKRGALKQTISLKKQKKFGWVGSGKGFQKYIFKFRGNWKDVPKDAQDNYITDPSQVARPIIAGACFDHVGGLNGDDNDHLYCVKEFDTPEDYIKAGGKV